MKLEIHERQGVVWGKIRTHLTDQVATLRANNDGDLTEIETARLRGRIAQIKSLLELDKDLPPVEQDIPD